MNQSTIACNQTSFRRVSIVVKTFLILVLLVGCHKQWEETSLGKVVVYRNGVAYFERTASAEDGEVTLMVPKDKVDDMLKSLSVQDADTQQQLPVSFPSRQKSGNLIKMKVTFPKSAKRIKLSYVAESPAWKPSYRIKLEEDGKVKLQGWAVVDNVSGEDWKDVLVGVGSSSALSFRYDLWSIQDVQRQTLSNGRRLAVAPPSGLRGRARPQTSAKNAVTTLTLDKEYLANMPVPGRTFDDALGAAAGTSEGGTGVSFSGRTIGGNLYTVDGVNSTSSSQGTLGASRSDLSRIADRAGLSGRPSGPERKRLRKIREERAARKRAVESMKSKMRRKNEQMAKEIKQSGREFIIEGIAAAGDSNGQRTAETRANHLRNEMIKRGVAPSKLSIRWRVGDVGEPETVKLTSLVDEKMETAESDNAVGESKFSSLVPVSIQHNGSSMVSVVDKTTDGETVYLYDATSVRGNQKYAFKSVRFLNPTNQQLEGGPVVVFGDQTFVGEGLSDQIAPGEETILPYALDKQVRIDKETAQDFKLSGIKSVFPGGAVVEQQLVRETSYELSNRSNRHSKVFVRHDRDTGWKQLSGPVAHEKIGKMSLFPVTLKAGSKETLSVKEMTPVTATFSFNDDNQVKQLVRYVKQNETPMTKSLKSILAIAAEQVTRRANLTRLVNALDMYRERQAELHAHLFSLKAVKMKGKVMRSLEKQMKDNGQKQAKTIEKIMKIRQEHAAEAIRMREMSMQASV